MEMAGRLSEIDHGVVVEGIGHTYTRGKQALKGINLEIGKGLFGLLGPNGAGKSTLMRILCTLLVPTEGRASVGGLDVVDQRRELRRLIGYLPQKFGAWRVQRVAEVLDTLAAISGIGEKGRRAERVEAVMAAVGLEDVAGRKVKKLSGGMLRRLGVAQALIHEPPFLIVDEPTVGLDPEERLRFRSLMSELAQERTIILSTHIVSDLGSGCADLALIHEGQLVFKGPPSELLERSKGRVVEVSVSGRDEAALLDQLEVVSRTTEEGFLMIRGVLYEGAVLQEAREVEDPSLEEAYLAFMLEKTGGALDRSREVL